MYAQQEAPSTSSAPGAEPATNNEPAPQTAEQVQALVAPIALYPDALVAQIVSGATFPDQIAVAQNWMLQHKDLSGKRLMEEVDKQSWDASVKALSQFHLYRQHGEESSVDFGIGGDLSLSAQGLRLLEILFVIAKPPLTKSRLSMRSETLQGEPSGLACEPVSR